MKSAIMPVNNYFINLAAHKISVETPDFDKCFHSLNMYK